MSVLKDLLTKAVKAMEGLADTEEGDSKTERRTDSSSNQSTSSYYKTVMELLFPNVYARRGRPRQLLIQSSPARKKMQQFLEKKKRENRMFQPFKRKGNFFLVV